MVFSTGNGSGEFFNTFRTVLDEHRVSQGGCFTVACSIRQSGGNAYSQFFQLRIYGYSPNPFWFTEEDLQEYLALPERKNEISNDNLFLLGENNILKVLEDTGFGEVLFDFNRERNNRLIIVCRTTISYRETIHIAN